MRSIFETCTPRPEVLTGDLRDEMFAAKLKDVLEGTADPVYQDPARFFENTFPTDGLKTLLREVAGRLSGESPSFSPFVRLETSFGGGKTHNLIALFHLARGTAPGLAESIVPASWRPKSPWKTVGIVGSDMDPSNGVRHPDVTTRTIWGEIAWQLGGAKGFAEVAESDVSGAAPGTGFLERLVGDAPCLLMLDEMARYLRAAKAVATANKRSDLAEQTVAFLMTLVEFAASRPKVSVVLTLADSADAFGSDTDQLKQELAEAKRVSARQERVLRPTGETEISRIVNHRLFRSVDAAAAAETAAAFAGCFSELAEKGVEIPQRVLRPEYRAEMEQDYPFHPELLTTLDRKTATIPNFQKTRGALRLLARVVRRLWAEKPKGTPVIAIHHLDLGEEGIVNDLTSRLERPQFASVVEADIASQRKGSESHAQSIDRKWVDSGKPPYARRAATAVFLHSLTQGIATGIEPGDLRVAVLGPGDDPHLLDRALQLMLGEEKGEPGTACWFLHFDTARYRFKTEPNLERVIQDEMSHVGVVKGKEELEQRIRNVWKKEALRPVFFPAEPFDLDDDAREPKLAVLHFDAAHGKADDATPPDLVLKLFTHAGSQQGYRIYKNNVLFLVADADQAPRMVAVARRHLGIQRLVSDSSRMAEFSEDQKKKLKAMRDSSELDVRIAITRAYRYLHYPSADAPRGAEGLARETLPAQDQGDVEKNQSDVVLKVLGPLGKLLKADDPPLPAAFVKAKAWGHGQQTVSTEDLHREFAKRIGLRLLLDPNQLKKTIKAGVGQGTWIYFDPAEQVGYGKDSPAPLVQLSDEAILYTPEEAARIGVRIKGAASGEQACPLCAKTPCVCGDDEEDKTTTGKAVAARLHVREEGAPGVVFQKVVDRFHDEKAGPVSRLVVGCEGTGKEVAADARSLGLAIPQLGKGSFRVDQTFNAELAGPNGPETISLSFGGSSDRYRKVKGLTDPLGQEAVKLFLRMVVTADFPEGLPVEGPQFQSIRDLFVSFGLGRISLEALEAERSAGEPSGTAGGPA